MTMSSTARGAAPPVDEGEVQWGRRVERGVAVRVSLVDATVTSGRVAPHSEGQPSCQTPTIQSTLHVMRSIDTKSILEPSASKSCGRISQPSREQQKFSPARLKMTGLQAGGGCKRLKVLAGAYPPGPACHHQTIIVATSSVDRSQAKDCVEDSLERGVLITDCSVSSQLTASNVAGECSSSCDRADSIEMSRTLPKPTRTNNHADVISVSREANCLPPTSEQIPPKVHSYTTSSVKLSMSRSILSLVAPNPRPVSPSTMDKSKFSHSCRGGICRPPLAPIANTNRIRLPKRSAVRVVVRKDLSPLGATKQPTLRTHPYTPPQRVVGGRKHREYLRLRAMLPPPRRRAAVSKVSVVCEAARHIEHLHGALIRRFRERLPPALAGCGLSSNDVGQCNIRQLVLRVLAACNPGSLPPAPLENTRSHQSPLQRPRGGDRRR